MRRTLGHNCCDQCSASVRGGRIDFSTNERVRKVTTDQSEAWKQEKRTSLKCALCRCREWYTTMVNLPSIEHPLRCFNRHLIILHSVHISEAGGLQ